MASFQVRTVSFREGNSLGKFFPCFAGAKSYQPNSIFVSEPKTKTAARNLGEEKGEEISKVNSSHKTNGRSSHTVDGRNAAPVDRYFILLFTGVYSCIHPRWCKISSINSTELFFLFMLALFWEAPTI